MAFDLKITGVVDDEMVVKIRDKVSDLSGIEVNEELMEQILRNDHRLALEVIANRGLDGDTLLAEQFMTAISRKLIGREWVRYGNSKEDKISFYKDLISKLDEEGLKHNIEAYTE